MHILGSNNLMWQQLSTSLQRTCTFGPCVPREYQDQYQYQPLVRHNAHRVTGFCYNDKGGLFLGQNRIGVLYEDESLGMLPDPPSQITHALPNSRIPQWFKSSGSLAGVSHIRLCVDNKKSHKPTVGMLLLYANRQESLGQWRYDCDVDDFELTGPVYFFSGETKTGPYTKVVCNREMGEGWNEITRTAGVVWWFTPDCSHIELSGE